jgi:signal transduction histidine kinase
MRADAEMADAMRGHPAARSALVKATPPTFADLDAVSRRRVRAVRLAFALSGVVLAGLSVLAWDPERMSTYLLFGVFLGASNFFTLPVPPPGMVLPLPYTAMMSAFGYIAGFPVIALDYAARVVVYPVIYVLVQKGLMAPPGFMRAVIDTVRNRRPLLNDEHVDDWAILAVGVVGFAARIGTFQVLTQALHVSPIAAVACAEIAGYGTQAAVSVIFPLPTSEWARSALRVTERADASLDPRMDEVLAFGLCQPPLVFLIFYGYSVHGLPGAAVWSASTLGVHQMLRLLSQRRTFLVEQRLEIQATSERLREANAELASKARALEEKQDELRDFVYTVTHDLKNPLGAIQITADLLRESDGGMLSAEGRDHLERMVRLAGHTDEMIHDLMEFFKITSTPEVPGWVELRRLVDRTLDTLSPQISSKSVRVDVGELPRVWGQATKLGHVVSNLIGNAVKYVPARSGVVHVSATAQNGHVTFAVRDNGIGIPAPYQQGIFELFGRVPTKDQHVDGDVAPGTGVGLAIVKRIVEAHGGRVWVESQAGGGAAFFVELPGGGRLDG